MFRFANSLVGMAGVGHAVLVVSHKQSCPDCRNRPLSAVALDFRHVWSDPPTGRPAPAPSDTTTETPADAEPADSDDDTTGGDPADNA
jgi:hypothetical protein